MVGDGGKLSYGQSLFTALVARIAWPCPLRLTEARDVGWDERHNPRREDSEIGIYAIRSIRAVPAIVGTYVLSSMTVAPPPPSFCGGSATDST